MKRVDARTFRLIQIREMRDHLSVAPRFVRIFRRTLKAKFVDDVRLPSFVLPDRRNPNGRPFSFRRDTVEENPRDMLIQD